VRLTIKSDLFLYFFTLSKGIDDAQSFLGYSYVFFEKTLFSFHILFSSASCILRHRRDYNEQKAVVMVQASLPGLLIKRGTF